MKKILFFVLLCSFLFSCATEQKRDNSKEQEEARQHSREAQSEL